GRRREPLPICRHVQPAARTGGVGERYERRPVELVPLTDARRQRWEPEEAPQCEAADGHDQPRPQELELPFAPERAELLLARRRRSIAASRWRTARIATRHRSAVERRVELV